MKFKVLPLIFIAIFATIATSVVLHLSIRQTAEENVDFTESYSILRAHDRARLETVGKEIDTPGMPG